MATTEAPIHENIKKALVDGDEHGTALIMRSMRNTERVFKNKDVEEVLRIEKEHPGDFSKISHLVSGQGYRKVFQETGEIDTGVWSAGTVCIKMFTHTKTCLYLYYHSTTSSFDS